MNPAMRGESASLTAPNPERRGAFFRILFYASAILPRHLCMEVAMKIAFTEG